MNRIITHSGILILAIVASILLINNHLNLGSNEITAIIPDGFDVKNEKKDKKVWEYFSENARANQTTGEVNIEEVLSAREEVLKLRANAKKRRAGNLNLSWKFMGPDNMGGRTRALLYDMKNLSRVYTGGVSGGLWFSNDGGNSWQPYEKNDTLAGSGVVSMTQTTSGDVYVGTGENFVGTSGITNFTKGFPGTGIWKSTDGGSNFVQLPSTVPTSLGTNIAWSFIPSMGAHPTDPNTLLAGTNKGLKISKDGGSSWSNASSNPVISISNIQDIDVAKNGDIYVVVNGSLYKGHIDDMTSFKSMMGGNLIPGGYRRICAAIAPSDNNYVYAIGCNNPGETTMVYRTTDNGTSWEPIAPTSLPSNSFNPTGQQGDYDMEIAVHPANKDRAYVGGQLNVWTYDAIAKSWWAISRGTNSPFDPFDVHVDHHRITFHPNDPNNMLINCDGGVFRTLNADEPYPDLPTYSKNNKGFGVIQYYGISANIDGKMLGGSQDNGAIYLNNSLNTPEQGIRLPGVGDGGFSANSNTNPSALFISGLRGDGGQILRSANGGNTTSLFYDSNIDCDQISGGQCIGDGEVDCGTPFIPSVSLWEQKDTNHAAVPFGEGRLFFGTYCGIWLAKDALNFSKNPTWFIIATDSTGMSLGGSFITYSEISEDGDYLFVGTNNGNLFRVEGLRDAVYNYNDNGTPDNPLDDWFSPTLAGITTTKIANFGGRYITEIAVNIQDPDIVVVSLGNYGNTNYVYKTTQATTAPAATNFGTFTTIQGNLPKMPVYSCEIDYYDAKNIIVGTEMGMFSSSNGGLIWQAEGDGMPMVPVFNMRQVQERSIYDECYVLYAGSFGRGIYKTWSLTDPTCQITTIDDPVIYENYLNIYPNPAIDQAVLSFTSSTDEELNLVVYSLDGKMVDQINLIVFQGPNTYQLKTTNYTTGTYLIVLQSNNNQAVSRLMINK